MKSFVAIIVLLVAATAYAQSKSNKDGEVVNCSVEDVTISKDWIDMEDACEAEVRRQIHMEIRASFVYLAMAAHFSIDTVNRPGFASFFFNSAKEEREHAEHLIDYLTMRGKLTGPITDLIKFPGDLPNSPETGEGALDKALKLEHEVTKSIRNVISTCEGGKNDYHLVDYLTGVYLEEQYKGQRELAGMQSTLKKMIGDHKEIGEFLFDKTLLS